jgi:peptide/nickel transport system substrate-binding protein
MPRTTYFPKIEKQDTSAYMMGWGGAITDAETSMTPLYRTRGTGGVGAYNYGGYRNDKADELAQKSSVEADPAKREALVKGAMKLYKDDIAVIPLHRQVIPWAVRQNVTPAHRADNYVELKWFSVGAKP